ncbi:hypothetical protein [Caulobacter sp. BK020]|uniref:hypothetical protein n=1 Tax=Caulobacter sp. BK020 TaxID=2512117 RepID=UPI0010EB0F26|nr:hypothetical protein [Caulobacter sp. BK020]TCS11928.1 hypothetical protein EV278_11640 [Caulobacter sp. BK020]
MAVDTSSGDAAAEVGGKPPPGPAPGAELRERLDQMGVILAKGLDLAEAGVSLGATILNRVSVAAQQKIREGLDAAGQPQPAAAGAAPEEPVEPGEAETAYGLANRLPLTPGGEVSISFSINNDSMTEVRKVEFRVQGFAGDTRQAAIDAAAFAVKPAQKTIAPVDFEKFVLKGVVPETVPPDVYRGVVVVRSDKDLFIPVVLVVTPP